MSKVGLPNPGSVITNEAMIASLRFACPDFAREVDVFEAQWAGKLEKPSYLLLSELADHLADRLEQGDTACFPQVFQVVERWLADGDAYVREATTVGLIEDLQKESRYSKQRPDALKPWLGPRAKLAWDDVAAFWENGTRIPDRSGREF